MVHGERLKGSFIGPKYSNIFGYNLFKFAFPFGNSMNIQDIVLVSLNKNNQIVSRHKAPRIESMQILI